jgi:hypothetical protein
MRAASPPVFSHGPSSFCPIAFPVQMHRVRPVLLRAAVPVVAPFRLRLGGSAALVLRRSLSSASSASSSSSGASGDDQPLIVSPEWVQRNSARVKLIDGSWYMPADKIDAHKNYLNERIKGYVCTHSEYFSATQPDLRGKPIAQPLRCTRSLDFCMSPRLPRCDAHPKFPFFRCGGDRR